jgi:diguanylate cyclase (GGDEF)-like protein
LTALTEVFTRFLENLARGMSWQDAHMAFWLDLGALGVEKLWQGQVVSAKGLLSRREAWKAQFPALDVTCSDGVYRVYHRDISETVLVDAQSFTAAVDALLHDHERLKDEATHDGLTGCLNRKGLQAWFDDRLRQGMGEIGFTLILMDFDNFKCLNDTHGHAKGDEALVAIVKALRAQLRAHDVVARVGGDEFVVALESCTCHPGIRARLETMKAQLPLDAYGLDVTMGVACYPQHGRDLAQLLIQADCRMYQGKRQGKGQIVLWEEVQA